MQARHWRVLRWVAVIAGGAVVTGAALFFVLPRLPGWVGRAPGQPLRQATASEEVQMDTMEVRCDVFSCGHEAITSGRVPTALLGFNRATYERRYPESRVTEFSGDRVVIETRRQELCTDCRNGQFIGAREGYVTVYAGRPDRPGPVVEVTRIPVHALPESERVRITKGIPVSGIAQRLQVLEGLSEYNER